MVVAAFRLDGLHDDPGDRHSSLACRLHLLLDGGQAAVVLRAVLALERVERVAVAREERLRERQQGDVQGVDGPNGTDDGYNLKYLH